MHKLLTVCLILTLCVSSAAAETSILSQDEIDFWHEQLEVLTDEIGTRTVWDPEIELARDALIAVFERYGYNQNDGSLLVEPADGQTDGLPLLSSDSLIATLPASQPDAPIAVICAHYDSNAPGARDNSSGVASMLTLMKHFTQQGAFENLELRFIAFTAEETGHQGSRTYVNRLTEQERQRTIAAFNIDILVRDTWEEELVLSLDTLGMRTRNGYQTGSEAAPANNRASKAMLQARQDHGGYSPEDLDITYCGVRHHGDSDHDSFHTAGIDSVNVCFRGTDQTGGHWPKEMHHDDVIGDFDYDLTYQALETLIIAVEGLAESPFYGD